jgi:hypothetical protein
MRGRQLGESNPGIPTRTPGNGNRRCSLRYYVNMEQRHKFALAVLLASLILTLGGCKIKQRPKPVIVRVLSNLASPYGHELDHRILEFQTSNPRTLSGRPIIVQTVEIGDYKDMLEKHVGRDTTVDLIILDSPQDALLNPGVQAQMMHAVNICAALKACPAEVPALIPSGIEGDRLEAAQKFEDALQKNPPA